MDFYETRPFESGHVLSEPLKIMKSALLQNPQALGGLVKYECEGYLNDNEAIVLNMQVGVPSRSPFGVLEQEKVAICVPANNPRKLQAFSLRKDFPSLPHLSASYKDTPRSLCLFDVPQMDRVYNETYVDFLLRVKKWLDRAAAGDLHLAEQAMEPFVLESLGYVVISAEAEKRIIEGAPAFDIFVSKYVPANKFSVTYIEIHPSRDEASESPVVALPIKGRPSSDQCINCLPRDYLELADLLREKLDIDLDREILKLVSNTYEKWRRKEHREKKLLNRGVVLAICIPRLNYKGIPSGHEIRAFHLSKPLWFLGKALGCVLVQQEKKNKEPTFVFKDRLARKEDDLKEIIPVPFAVVQPFSRDLAKSMAGLTIDISDIRMSAIGLGALGSQVVLNLSRQGFAGWRLVDDDLLLPHNFARHGLSAGFRGQSKAAALAIEIGLILDKAAVKAYDQNFHNLRDVRKEILNTSAIVDFSASYSVFMDLCCERKRSRALSVYFSNGGFTSVLLSEDRERKIRLDDIDLQLKIQALTNPLIGTIYRRREGNQLVYSTSCNSQTAVMPQDLVSIHAGIITRQIKGSIFSNDAKVFVNVISEEHFGVKVEQFSPCEVTVKEAGPWELRISQLALTEMSEHRRLKLPNETGGVLIGWISSYNKIIYVGKALPAPEDSVERPYYFIRGKKGLYAEVQRMRKASNDDLRYVGEWHTHSIGSSVRQSPDDLKSMAKLSGTMLEEGLPGVMLILADDNELGCYVQTRWG